MSADLSSKVEDLERCPDDPCYPDDSCYPDGPADFSHIKTSVWYGPSARLFWNLEDYPISASADLVSICRCLKLALHRMGVHGFLQIFGHGGTFNRNDDDLHKVAAHMTHTPKEGQMSIAAQMCVDMLRFVNTYPCRSVFVVIARQEPGTVLNRVLDEKKGGSLCNTVTTGESRIQIYPGGDDKAVRHERMLVDVLLWLVNHQHLPHLIIGGKLNKEVFDFLVRLNERGHGVYLAIAIPKEGTVGIEQVYTFFCGTETETETEIPHPKKLKA